MRCFCGLYAERFQRTIAAVAVKYMDFYYTAYTQSIGVAKPTPGSLLHDSETPVLLNIFAENFRPVKVVKSGAFCKSRVCHAAEETACHRMAGVHVPSSRVWTISREKSQLMCRGVDAIVVLGVHVPQVVLGRWTPSSQQCQA